MKTLQAKIIEKLTSLKVGYFGKVRKIFRRPDDQKPDDPQRQQVFAKLSPVDNCWNKLALTFAEENLTVPHRRTPELLERRACLEAELRELLSAEQRFRSNSNETNSAREVCSK